VSIFIAKAVKKIMINRSSLRTFWFQWIIANLISLGVGLTFPFSIPVVREFFGRASFVSLGSHDPGPIECIVAAVFMGFSQWLVLRNKIARLNPLWTVTSIIGLSVSSILILFLEWSQSWVIREYTRFIQDVQGTFMSGIIGGFIGGLLIGTAQCLILGRWRSWILLNGIAWSLTWATALAISIVVERVFQVKLNISLSGSIELMMFGSILGFVSSLITGTYLVRLLKRDDV
jgi:hypothetical protein